MRPRRLASDEAGFTIVEVLVAFALAAVATLLVIQAAGDAALGGRRIAAADLVLDECEGIVARRVADGTLRAGAEEGRFSDGRSWTLVAVDLGPSLGWRNLPPVWQVRLREGGPDGRLVYMTVVPGGLGGA